MAVLQTRHTFYNTYLYGVKKQLPPRSPGLSQEPTPSHSSGTADSEDAAPSGYSTPLSSAPSEGVIDPAMFLVETWPGDKPMGCTAAEDPLEATPDPPMGVKV
ncbi:hypothetical protein NW767_015540 [Fusarium falciforme]|nr:hypothetical protein NW767_015540 [Fusarium falciforme]